VFARPVSQEETGLELYSQEDQRASAVKIAQRPYRNLGVSP